MLSKLSLTVLHFVLSDTSFPTPMEEPKKVLRCHYLGTTQVLRPTGESYLLLGQETGTLLYLRILLDVSFYVCLCLSPSFSFSLPLSLSVCLSLSISFSPIISQ